MLPPPSNALSSNSNIGIIPQPHMAMPGPLVQPNRRMAVPMQVPSSSGQMMPQPQFQMANPAPMIDISAMPDPNNVHGIDINPAQALAQAAMQQQQRLIWTGEFP